MSPKSKYRFNIGDCIVYEGNYIEVLTHGTYKVDYGIIRKRASGEYLITFFRQDKQIVISCWVSDKNPKLQPAIKHIRR